MSDESVHLLILFLITIKIVVVHFWFLIASLTNFILTRICLGCCGFSCYLHNEFVDHLNQEHQQCDKFCCYICANKDDGEGFFALHPSLMITVSIMYQNY